jgi:hypothetical protein
MVTDAEAAIQRKRIEVRRTLDAYLKRRYWDKNGNPRIHIREPMVLDLEGDWWGFTLEVDGIQVMAFYAEGDELTESVSGDRYLAHAIATRGLK